MNTLYSEELIKFMSDRGLGVDNESDLSRNKMSGTRLASLKASRLWPLLKPLRVVYARARYTAMLSKEIGFKEAVRAKKTQYRFSKNYINGLMPDDKTRGMQSREHFPRDIKFSILAPLYNTPEKYLRDMMDSVLSQTYQNYELCLADGSDHEHSYVETVCREYSQRDSRIVYRRLEENLGIAENTNACIDMSSGDYIVLFDHDDILMPTALYDNMKAICEQDADFIYSDEATFLGDDIYDIVTYHFKPDFAIDNLRACNYICHLSVFSRELLERAGRFDAGYDGSQDHDIILRLTQSAKRIVHIPKILYLWRSHKNSVSQDINSKKYAIDAGRRAVRDSLMREKIRAEVVSSPAFPTVYKINYELTARPKISIIIPNKDNLKLLAGCVDSIIKKSTYDNYELIIVENNSSDLELFEYYRLIEELDFVRVLKYDKAFNYSAVNNYAAAKALGEYLIFLNNDIEIITPAWMEELLMYGQREDVGAVGAKLYYGNNTVQHGGVIIGAGPDKIAIHSHAGESRESYGYMCRLFFAQDVSAVTAACMLVRKKIFDEQGGFDEGLAVAYNDVDLCLKIRQKGYLIVFNPYAEAYHFESLSRGLDTLPENIDRFRREVMYMKDKWGDTLCEEDPFYNPNVSKERPWKFGITL